MKNNRFLRFHIAALLLLSAALCAPAQSRNNAHTKGRASAKTTKTTKKATGVKTAASAPVASDTPPALAPPAPLKKNARQPEDASASQATSSQTTSTTGSSTGAPASNPDAKSAAASDPEAPRYVYEFRQPESFVTHIRIEHDAAGRGRITFERRNDTEPITDPLELSPVSLKRINALWEALRFLDTEAVYQAARQYPHLGTARLQMARGTRQRTAEFNWTEDANASALAREYRNLAEQAMFVFEVNISLENQPLELPKLLTRFERIIETKSFSDPQQLVPLIRSLQTDERVPLIARNQAGRLLKKLEK